MIGTLQVALEAPKVAGKESIALESFGRALTQLPTIISDNAGLDSAELIARLRAAHSHGKNTVGIGNHPTLFIFRRTS